jgi:hypothetical protein
MQINPRKKAWISLDSFGRIGSFQWVTANPDKKSSSVSHCVPNVARRACFRLDPQNRKLYHNLPLLERYCTGFLSWPGLSRLDPAIHVNGAACEQILNGLIPRTHPRALILRGWPGRAHGCGKCLRRRTALIRFAPGVRSRRPTLRLVARTSRCRSRWLTPALPPA